MIAGKLKFTYRLRGRQGASRVLAGLFSFGLAVNSQAQPDAPRNPQSLPEEITVQAPESLTRLKRRVNDAEEAMYDLFNTLNDDDRFDIHCRLVKRRQSNMRERICTPNYFETAREEEAEFFLKSIGHPGTVVTGPGAATIARDNAVLEEKMKTAVQQHPAFFQAIQQFNRLKEDYEEKRQARIGAQE